MTRLHERKLELVADELAAHGEVRRWLLRSPAPGWFRPLVDAAAWCHPGTAIGALDVLGRVHLLVVPPGVAGSAGPVSEPGIIAELSPHAVGYRDPVALLSSSPTAAAGELGASPADDDRRTDGLVFRAPTSGRFYGRPAPDKPPFVAPGSQLTHGVTIGLLEVMKTFHRVTYGGTGLPDTANVVEVLVGDGDDVNAGDPLLALA